MGKLIVVAPTRAIHVIKRRITVLRRPCSRLNETSMAEREAAEEPIRWEDALDVDDSDLFPLLAPSSSSSPHPHTVSSLPPLLRPCSRFSPPPSQTLAPVPSPSPPSVHRSAEEPSPSSASTAPLIPGPAGAIQAAMRRQSATARRDSPFLDDHRVDDRGLDLGEEDGDFKLNPWLCALEFLGGRDRQILFAKWIGQPVSDPEGTLNHWTTVVSLIICGNDNEPIFRIRQARLGPPSTMEFSRIAISMEIFLLAVSSFSSRWQIIHQLFSEVQLVKLANSLWFSFQLVHCICLEMK
ncbi:hypothetical protein B296_00005153 [Ensete ventricosum]|uniref:Uncharacterized protein n=1 Tax=Ensete ventricosum TaxID=4639 RepID=A0A426ZDW6_ENSVE|nr:hypothetical protein B296_00005153 [Ensete ventricosum]